jgi:hypothetical protein
MTCQLMLVILCLKKNPSHSAQRQPITDTVLASWLRLASFICLQSCGNPFVYGGEERPFDEAQGPRAKREKEIDKLSIVCTVAAW